MVAAFVSTAPPYEWPTARMGPGTCSSTLAMYAESIPIPRRGFAGAVTFTPFASSSSTTPFQLDASAKAPWTRTTVGVSSDMRAPLVPAEEEPRRGGSHRVLSPATAPPYDPSQQSYHGAPMTTAQVPGLTRTDLQRHDLSIPGRELIQNRVDISPDAPPVRHRHPGEEIIYVLEGTLEYSIDGREPSSSMPARPCSYRAKRSTR